MTPQKVGETSTEDIRLAAFLILNNIALVRIEKAGRLGTFVFKEAKSAELIVAFMGRKALVEPLTFMSTIRSLKSQVDNLEQALGRG